MNTRLVRAVIGALDSALFTVQMLGLCAAFFVAFLVLSTAPALGNPPSGPPVIGGGTGAGPSTPIGNPGPGGSTGTPTPPPGGDRWVYGTIGLGPDNWSGHHYDSTGDDLVHVAYSCSPKGADNDWWATSAWYQYGVSEDGTRVTGIAVGCIWPPEPTDTPVTCASRAVVTIRKEVGPAGESLPRLLDTVSDRSAWASNRSSVAACAASHVAASTYLPLVETGGYAVATLATTHPCIRRDYHDGRATRIVSCGSPRDRATTARIGIYCTDQGLGIDKRASAYDHSWGFEACTREGGLIECVGYQADPRFAGVTGTRFEVLDDGNARSLTYPRLRVRGLVGAPTNISTRLAVGGSPYRAGAGGPDAPTQPFYADGARFGTTSGDRATWSMRWLAPGAATQPWTGTKHSTFDGRLRVQVYTVEQVDIWGAVTYGTTTRTIAISTACSTQTASVDVYRARLLSTGKEP